ncbi:MAG: DUF3343 domain-containing protein [Clostridia bacterium]|nr:DUF3343 domain-containing protein [Clostridia bacterium]
MRHLIISFKSRNSLYSFIKIARQQGISVSIINTPRSISISCGLSAKSDFRFYKNIVNIIRQTQLNGFLGIYSIEKLATHEQVQKLY